MLERNYVERPESYAHSPFVDVYLTSNINVAPFSTIVPFDTVVTNDNGVWDSINKWFVCPKAGRVFVTATVNFGYPENSVVRHITAEARLIDPTNTNIIRLRRFAQIDNYTGLYCGISGSTVFNVNFGDLIYIVGYTHIAATLTGTNAGAGELTHASIYYLP